MKCHNLVSGKNKKNISICHLLKILPGALSVKQSVRLAWPYNSNCISVGL